MYVKAKKRQKPSYLVIKYKKSNFNGKQTIPGNNASWVCNIYSSGALYIWRILPEYLKITSIKVFWKHFNQFYGRSLPFLWNKFSLFLKYQFYALYITFIVQIRFRRTNHVNIATIQAAK